MKTHVDETFQHLLLIVGSGFLTDAIGEALGTVAGPGLPCGLGDPEGPRAGDSCATKCNF